MADAPPSSIDAFAIRRRLGVVCWAPPRPFGPDGWRFDSQPPGKCVIVTCAAFDDDDGGHEWVHASVSRVDEMPSYADLALLHAAVFVTGWAYQVFASPSAHVNIHERALHLFGRVDGAPVLPDFTMGTGSI